MSDEWDKAINKNLEQFIIPQPSVLHKVMHRGTRSQRPAASSRENHCSHCGQPGHRRSHGSLIHVQPSCNHTNKLQNIINSSFNLSHFISTSSCLTPCPHILKTLLPKHTLLLSGIFLTVNNRRLSRWQYMHNYITDTKNYLNDRVLLQQHHGQP